MGSDVSAQSSSQFLIRKAIVDSAFSQVGNYEKTNRNDGKVDKYRKQFLKFGAKKGDAYCSWGLLYCLKNNGIKPKIDGRAISWSIPKESVVRYYGTVTQNKVVRKGDFALSKTWDYRTMRYQYHIEIITAYDRRKDYCNTVGFNTWSNKENVQKRQGVWTHQRKKKNLIICNQLDIYFKHEKANTFRIANILGRLQRTRISEN